MKTYKLEIIREKMTLKTFMLGAVKLPYEKIEELINQKASEGWEFEDMAVETDRSLIFWSRETAVLVFSRTG